MQKPLKYGKPEELKLFFLERWPSPFFWEEELTFDYKGGFKTTYITKGLKANFRISSEYWRDRSIKSINRLRTHPRKAI